MPPVDIAISLFGYQNHVSIDRGFGFIRKWAATDAAAYEGRRLREGLLDKTNTASGAWADTAYRWVVNEAFLTRNGFTSHIHRKKPKGRAMPEVVRRANNAKTKIRSRVEHVFAEQKDRMGLFIRPSGSPGPRSRSAWPISSTTSNVCYSFAGPRSREGISRQKNGPLQAEPSSNQPNQRPKPIDIRSSRTK